MKTTIAAGLLALSIPAHADVVVPVGAPIDSLSMVEITSMSFSGPITLPLGSGFADVPSTISLWESAATPSLVTTHLTGNISAVMDDARSTVLSSTIDLTVESSFTLYYEGELTASGGSFAPGVPDPIAITPGQPFQFQWSATASATVDFTSGGTVTQNLLNETGAFVAGTNVVSIPLPVDLGGTPGNETITLTFDQVGVDPLLVNGVSLGGFSLASDGSFSYDDSGFDLNGLLAADLQNPVISFANGTLLVSGSVNPSIGQVALDGSFVTSPVPLPPAAWLLLSGLAGLAALGRRRRPMGAPLAA